MLVTSCFWKSGGWWLGVSVAFVVLSEYVYGTAVLHSSRHDEHYSLVKFISWTAVIRRCDL